MLKRLPIGLIAAVVVYVVLRGLILFTAFDQVGMTQYELYPMGTLPKVVLEGASIPLRVYYDNAAGQLLTGLCAVPCYLAFGETWLALKLVPAGFGLLTLVVLWLLIDRLASRRAANLAALLFAFGPVETITKYSLLASGNHFENLFFTTLAVYCAYRVHLAPATAEGERERGRWLLAEGFSAGLALFVFLGAVIPVGLLAIVHLGLRGWRQSLRDLVRVAPPFLVAVAPLIALNLSTGARGASFLENKFSGEGNFGVGRVLERMVEFLGVELPRAGFFTPFGGESLAIPNTVFLVAFLVAWLAALPAAARGVVRLVRGAVRAGEAESRASLSEALVVPFVVYLPLAALAFGLSDLRIGGHRVPILVAGYRYFLPHFLFAIVLIACTADRWLAGATAVRRAAGAALFGFALATGAWNAAYLDLSFSATGLGRHYIGWNFVQAARGLLLPTNEIDPPGRVEHANAFAAPIRQHLYRGLGFHEAQKQMVDAWGRRADGWPTVALRECLLDLPALLAEYPEEVHIDVARGAGAGLRTLTLNSSPALEALAEHLAALAATGHPWAAAVIEGAASVQDYPPSWFDVPRIAERTRFLFDVMAADEAQQHVAFGRGIGVWSGRLLARAIPAEEIFLTNWLYGLMGPAGTGLLEGLGEGLAEADSTPQITSAVFERIPETLLPPVVLGYARALRHLYGEQGAQRFLDELPERWRDAAR